MSSLDRLRAAGLVNEDLPEEVSSVLEGLSEHEVDVLVSVGERLGLGDVEGFAMPGGLGGPVLNTGLNPIMRPPVVGPNMLGGIAAADGGNSGKIFF